MKGLRLLLILAVIGAVLFLSIRAAFYITSFQAVIDTDVVTLRSPIIGNLDLADNVRPGAALQAGSEVFSVENPRFGNLESSSQYTALQNQIDQVNAEIAQQEIIRKRLSADTVRFRALVDSGGVAVRDLEQAESDLAAADKAVADKTDQLDHVRARFAEIEKQVVLHKRDAVSIPRRGVVWAVLKQDGEFLNIDDAVVQVAYPDEVRVEAFFSERHARGVAAGAVVEVSEIGSKRRWAGIVETVRAGVGRVSYSAPVVVPPEKLKERLIAARIRVEWKGSFSPEEFYGIGRSMVVKIRRK